MIFVRINKRDQVVSRTAKARVDFLKVRDASQRKLPKDLSKERIKLWFSKKVQKAGSADPEAKFKALVWWWGQAS